MKRTTKIVAGLTGVLLLGAVLAVLIRAQDTPDRLERDPDAIVHVEGMACQLCARSMRKSVGELEGVSDVEVLPGEQEVHITLENDTPPSEEDFENAVTEAGFTFKKVVYAGDRSGAERNSESMS